MAPDTCNRRKYCASYGPNPKDCHGYLDGTCRKIATMAEEDLCKFHEECYLATATITDFDEKDFFWAKEVGRQSFQKKIFEWDFTVEGDWRPVCLAGDGTPMAWSHIGSPMRTGSVSPDYASLLFDPPSHALGGPPGGLIAISTGTQSPASSIGSPAWSVVSGTVRSSPSGHRNGRSGRACIEPTQWRQICSSMNSRLAGTSLSDSSDATRTTEGSSTLTPSSGTSTSSQSAEDKSTSDCNS